MEGPGRPGLGPVTRWRATGSGGGPGLGSWAVGMVWSHGEWAVHVGVSWLVTRCRGHGEWSGPCLTAGETVWNHGEWGEQSLGPCARDTV